MVQLHIDLLSLLLLLCVFWYFSIFVRVLMTLGTLHSGALCREMHVTSVISALNALTHNVKLIHMIVCTSVYLEFCDAILKVGLTALSHMSK